jgi:hypothetical protein
VVINQTLVSMTRSKEQVAVVVPLSDRPHLTPDELISLRHLMHFLGDYPKYLVAPVGLDMRIPGFATKRFSPQYFGSAKAYTRLVLSREFFASFTAYEYILIYHLDALVFSDQLREWCDAGFDYLGAPWLRSEDDPSQGFSRVGNSGFSLRNVSAALRVIDSRRYTEHPDEYWAKAHASKPWHLRLVNRPRKWAKHLVRFNGVRRELSRYRHNDDIFWANRAQRYDPGFRIAPVETALRFAFELAPRYCYEQNGRELPFGCHAWARYDRAFWEPFLLDGDDAPEILDLVKPDSRFAVR